MPIDDWTIAFKEAFAEAEEAEQLAAARLHLAEKVQAAAAEKKLAAEQAQAAAQTELARLEALIKSNPERAKRQQRGLIKQNAGLIATAEQELAASAQEIDEAGQQLRDALQRRTLAVATARGEYSRANRALRPKVAELRALGKDHPINQDDHPINQLYTQLEATLHADDFDMDELYAQTLELERQVLSLIGPAKAPALLEQCSARLEVQGNGPFKTSPALAKIRKELKRITTDLSPEALAGADPSAARGVAMVALSRMVEPALDAFEAAATKFQEAYDALELRLATLATHDFRLDEALVALVGQKKASLVLAGKDLEAGYASLLPLADAIGEAEDVAAQNEQDAAPYQNELAAVRAEADSFDRDNKGLAQANRKKLRIELLAVAEALVAGPVGTWDYTAARRILSWAAATQVGLRAWAQALAEGQNQRAQEAAQAAAAQAAQMAAAAAAALALQQAQSALNSASLAAIGKNKFGHWMSHLGVLLQQPVPPVQIHLGFQGALKEFTGVAYTAEVACTILDTATGVVVGDFVVHYHPRLPKSADSRFHAKKGRSIPSQFKMSESGHWLVSHGGVPPFDTFH